MKDAIIFFLVLILMAGCSWDNEEALYPDMKNCDTLGVSFALDIVPVLSDNCYFCHSNENASEFGQGHAFEDYEDVRAASSTILGAIKHMNGFSPMPKGSGKLDNCSIETFEAWVNAGMPAN